MQAKAFTAPKGEISLTAGSILVLGGFFYAFLGAAPVTGIAHLHRILGLEPLMSVNDFCTLGHMAVYGAATLGLCALFRSANTWPLVAGALMAVGIAIEFLQEQYFGRQFQIGDMLANTAGIVVALMILAAWVHRRRP